MKVKKTIEITDVSKKDILSLLDDIIASFEGREIGASQLVCEFRPNNVSAPIVYPRECEEIFEKWISANLPKEENEDER